MLAVRGGAAETVGSVRKAFDLPAGAAESTLRKFSTQAGHEVIFAPAVAAGVTTNPVRGELAPTDAIRRLLDGTGLIATQDAASGAFMVNRAPRPNVARLAEAPNPVRPVNKVPASDDAVVLSPFEVVTTKDQGYAATHSLSGSRLATELKFIPAPVSVMTRELLDDLGVSDVQEAMQWTVNSNAGTTSDANSGALQNGQTILSQNNNDIRTRGGINLSVTRNYFKWSVNSDTSNVERLDVSRGPNAMLFGDSSLSGSVNVSTKRADFRQATTFQFQASSFGGGRAAIDVNQPLVERRLALRVNAYAQRTDDWRDYGMVDRHGVALASTWRPIRDLEIRVEGEVGRRNDIFAATYLRSAITGWNHMTVFDSPGALTAAQAAAAGLRRLGANTLVVNNARAQDGPIDWASMGDTVVTAGEVETRLATRLWAGSRYLPVSITETATLSATPVRRDLTVPSFAYSVLNAAANLEAEHHTASIFAEKRFGRKLFVEVAGNFQDEDRLQHTRQGDTIRVSYDVNRQLPAGYTINGSTANPNFLRPYVQSLQRIFNNYTRVWEARSTAVYQLELSWLKQSLGVLAGYRRFDAGQTRRTLTRTNGATSLSAAANQINFRSYIAERDRSSFDYRDGRSYDLAGATIAYVNHSGVSGGQTHADSIIRSYQVFASGSWLKNGRLHTTLGVRRDEFYSKQFGAHVFDPVTQRYVRSDLTDILRARIDSPSAGAVLEVTRWLALYANTSKSYNPPTQAVLNYQGRPIDAPEGKTREYGLKFSFLENRISGSAGYYKSEQKNNTGRNNGLNSAYDGINAVLGLPIGSAPFDSNTLAASGREFELVANPTSAWTLTANIAFPHTSTRNTLVSFRQLYAANEPAWRGIANNAADPRSGPIRSQLAAIDAILSNAAQGEGLEGTRNRKSTANLLSRYRFASGPLKGLSLGGGFNYQGPQKIARNAVAGDIYTDGFYLFTAFARYQGLWRRCRWSAQVNAANLLDTEKFRYTSLNASGVPDAYRVASPRELRFTGTLSF